MWGLEYSQRFRIRKRNLETRSWKPIEKKAPELVPFDIATFQKTLDNYHENIFIEYLLKKIPFPFPLPEVEKVIEEYYLGTIPNEYGYGKGAITFPFINRKYEVRFIQVKQFDRKNHSTGNPSSLNSILKKYHTENNIPLPEWLDMYLKQDKFTTCLFGEHLLSKYPNNPIGLVEAPKTAIYATLYFRNHHPLMKDAVWLATGSKGTFTKDRVRSLQGRTVYVFPDLSKDGSTFKEWENKAKQYESELPRTKFIVIDLIDLIGGIVSEEEREEGFDMADYLENTDWRTFREQPPQEPVQPPQPQIQRIQRLKKETPESWSQSIDELEKYFSSIHLPIEPLRLNESSLITDCSLFIESHLTTLKQYNGNKTFLPYLERLYRLKDVLASTAKKVTNLTT